MKKNVLALSIAAMVGSFAGVAQASVIVPVATAAAGNVLGTRVSATIDNQTADPAPLATTLAVNPNNVGHMLVVPYYTAQNGNMSVIHLSNTDLSNGKAVKIRFRGAANSDDVKDFQIFLSPGDVWTGAVAQGAGGAAVLYSADKSCTVPAIPATGTPFSTSRLNVETNVNGTREGYVEIFNMGDIPSVKLYDDKVAAVGVDGGKTGTANSILYTAIKHKDGVAPCSTETSAARTTLNDIAMHNFVNAGAAASVGFGGATTGLSADWYILNLNQTTAFSGAATAVEARDGDGVPGAANFVHFPQTAAGSSDFFTGTDAADRFTADPLLRGNIVDNSGTKVPGTPLVTPQFIDLPDMSTPYVAAATDFTAPKLQAVALTSALARTSVSNQFALDAGITAQTDRVFSQPTRRCSVAANYKADKTSDALYRVYSDLSTVDPTGIATLEVGKNEWFYAANTSVDANGNICVTANSMRFFDREETTSGAAPIFSPAPASELRLCGETTVVSFSSGKVLGSSTELTAVGLNAPYVNGWTVVSVANGFTGAGPTAAAGVLQGGLPILGNAFIKLKNDGAAAGFASTFGITWAHRYGR